MSRPKLVLLSLLAVFLASAAGATSASASFTVEGTELETAATPGVAEAVDGVVGVVQLNSVIAGLKVIIECTANKMASLGNAIEGEGRSSFELTYKQCYPYTVSKRVRELSATCRVAEPIAFTYTGVLLKGPGGLVEDKFKPPEAGVFTTLKIEKTPGKTCLIEGSFKVEGSYTASLGDEAEIEATEHEIVFTSTGGASKLGTESASITNVIKRAKLVSGKKWASSALSQRNQVLPSLAMNGMGEAKIINEGNDEVKLKRETLSANLRLIAAGCENATLATDGSHCETGIERTGRGAASYTIEVEVPLENYTAIVTRTAPEG